MHFHSITVEKVVKITGLSENPATESRENEMSLTTSGNTNSYTSRGSKFIIAAHKGDVSLLSALLSLS